jgi:hypothetical protein
VAKGDQERVALQQQLDSEKAAAESARARGDDLGRQLAASRAEAAASKEAAAGKEAQAQVRGARCLPWRRRRRRDGRRSRRGGAARVAARWG